MTYLRSVWAMADSAPYTMLTVAIVPMSGTQSCVPSGSSPIPSRTIP